MQVKISSVDTAVIKQRKHEGCCQISASKFYRKVVVMYYQGTGIG